MGKGFAAGPGAGQSTGSGGSHGGRGGRSNLVPGTLGGPYGSYKYPSLQGSGGSSGGKGGGALILHIAESVVVDGVIDCSGQDGSGSGGSGGSVFIESSGSFSGDGEIKVNGGLASSTGSGGGGGGRIAVWSSTTSFVGKLESKGGKAGNIAYTGSPGTIYENVGVAGTFLGDAFSSYDFSPSTQATFTGDAFEAHDFSPAVEGTFTGNQFILYDFSPTTQGTFNAATFAPYDFSLSTKGEFRGASFTAYDFLNNADETLIVIVDGIDVSIVLNTNFEDVAAAASGITIAGASISTDGSVLKITSDSTGTSSSITVVSNVDSDANALALFRTWNQTGVSVSGTSAAEILTVVVDGTEVATTLNANFVDVAAVASGISIAGATVAVDGGNYLKITSDTTGSSSSITIKSDSGTNAIALFGTGVAVDGIDSAVETLTVVVNGVDIPITLDTNFADVTAAANGISIAGASLSQEGNFLKITSDATGTSSTVAIKPNSGTNAKALFGVGIAVAGTSDAETLHLILDGKDVAVLLDTNFADVAAAANLLKIPGATVTVNGNYLKITSEFKGSSSSVTIKSDSGTNAKACFGSGSSDSGITSNTDIIDRLTIDNLDAGKPNYVTPIFLQPGITTYSITNLYLLNQARVSFQPGSTVGNQQRVVAVIGTLHGDATGTLDVVDLSNVILSNNGLEHKPVSYELSTQRTGPQENMVISKMKYYMNDYLNAAMHIQVRLNGILITPPRLSLSGSTELVVHGHLSGATSLVIGSESSVTLKNTAHTDNNMANHFTFDDLVIEDGGELHTEANASTSLNMDGVPCVITGNNFTLGSAMADAILSTVTVSGGINISMNHIRITKTGFVNGKGSGWNADQGPGAGKEFDGDAFQRGSYGSEEHGAASGGSYGGRGGRSGLLPGASLTSSLGGVYGNYKYPKNQGSGGHTNNAAGGKGGGALILNIAESIVVDGIIDFSGEAGTSYVNSNKNGGGGGSGGTVFIMASTASLSGSGNIKTNGGDGSPGCMASSYSQTDCFTGGGGGGRIAVHCNSSSYSGKLQNNGGAG